MPPFFAALHPLRVPVRRAVRAHDAALLHDHDVLHLVSAHHSVRNPLLRDEALRRPAQPGNALDHRSGGQGQRWW